MYRIETESIDNGKGYWDYLKCHIMNGEEEIGEYQRNYSTLFNTFHPFTLNGKDYALYSKDYTATRIMSLPDCKDLGGEDHTAGGFCPTDYFVPEIYVPFPLPDENDPEPSIDNTNWIHKVDSRWIYPSSEDHPKHSPEFVAAYKAEQDRISELRKEWDKRHPYTRITAPFGFVAGCHWGDDSSWKIQYLDLSRIEEGIITRDDRFGYIELPAGLKLEQVINLDHYDYDIPYVEIAVVKRFHINGEEDA